MSYTRDSSQDLIYNEYSHTYELASKLYSVTIDALPSGSIVEFSGGTVSGNTVSGTYNTMVSYSVSKTGFVTQTGNIILTHNDTIMIILSNSSGGSAKTGGGGGQPTYLNIDDTTVTTLFAFSGSAGTFYALSENPSIQEPLYDNSGQKLSNRQIIGKKGNKIIIKNTDNNTTSECTINQNSVLKNKNITSSTFYGNGGGGSGAEGEDWIVGKYQRRRKGGAGGGYYWLNPTNLSINSVNGRDAGTIKDSEYPEAFPNVYSGKGGASGIDNGATVLANQTNRKTGIGASGNSSAINPYNNIDDTNTHGGGTDENEEPIPYLGSGGGGAGGDEDASGGKAGKGNNAYINNTTGENAYNYHATPTESTNYKKQKSPLGRGGNPFIDSTSNVQGNNGWIYIYKFEEEYQTFDMGRIGADPEAVSEIIDGMSAENGYIERDLSNDQVVWRTIDGTEDVSNDQPITDIINGDLILYETQWKDCGSITDTNIEENIRLGGI